MSDLVGWIATAIFASSYFFSGPARLRWVQASAAMIWMAYGVMIGAKPVVAANLIVAGAAAYTSFVSNRSKATA